MDFSITEDRLREVIQNTEEDDFDNAFRLLAREMEAELGTLVRERDSARFRERARLFTSATENLQGHRLWPGFHLSPQPEELYTGLHDLLYALLEARELAVITRTGVEWLRQVVALVRRAEDIQFTLETQYLPWSLPDDLEEALAALAAENHSGAAAHPRPPIGRAFPAPAVLSRQDLRLAALEVHRVGLEASIRTRLLHAALAERIGRPELVPEADLALPESLHWHVSGWTAHELIDQLDALNREARRAGLPALEEELRQADLHPLVQAGLALLLDGAPWETIEEGLASAVDEDRRRLEEKQNLIDRGLAGLMRRDPPDQLYRILTAASGPPDGDEGAASEYLPLIERMTSCAEQVRAEGDEALGRAAEQEQDGMLRLALRIAHRYGEDRGRFQSRLSRLFDRSEEDQDLLAAIAAEGVGLIYEQPEEDALRARLAAIVPFADRNGESAAGVAALQEEVRAAASEAGRRRARPRLAELLIRKSADPTDGLRSLEELAGVSAEAEATAELLIRVYPDRAPLRDLKDMLQRSERQLGRFLARRRELEAELVEWLDGPVDRPAGGPSTEEP